MSRYVQVEVEVDLADIDTEDLENELERRNRGQLGGVSDDDDGPVEQGGPLSHWPVRRLWDSVYLQVAKTGATEELRELIYRATGRIV